MIHTKLMVIFLVCASISLIGVLTSDDVRYLVTFYSFLILSGIEKICMKLEELK